MFVISGLKRLISLSILSFILLSPSVVGQSYAFVAGEDYDVIREQASSDQRILEHFSLYCGHCYASESIFSALKTTLAKNVNFERSHVLFLPQNNKKFGQNMTFGYAAAVELGIEDKFVAKVFDYHFNDKTWLGSASDLKNIFVVLGQTSAIFESTINGESTLKRVKAMVAKAQQDNVRFTPDLIVNDKYRINLQSLHNKTEKQQRLNSLVNYLLTNP